MDFCRPDLLLSAKKSPQHPSSPNLIQVRLPRQPGGCFLKRFQEGLDFFFVGFLGLVSSCFHGVFSRKS